MNKNFMILAASAVMLASCSNDETVELFKGDAISFHTAVKSRGEVLDNSTLESFVVSAFDSKDQPYFSKALFEKSGLYFKGTDEYFWPVNGGSLSFMAYAPASIEGVTVTKDNVVIPDFTPSMNISEHVDLVTASTSGNKSDKSVALEFAHHLTQIELTAQNSSSSYDVQVTGVRIGRLIGSATFNLKGVNEYGQSEVWDFGEDAQGEMDPELPAVPADPYANRVNYTTEYDTPILLNDDEQSIMGSAGNALVIPQEVTRWESTGSTSYDGGVYIAVKVKVTTKEGALIFPATDKYEWVATPFPDNYLEGGKKYAYRLDFSYGFGYVDPEKGHDPNKTYDPEEQPKDVDKKDPFQPGGTTEGEPIRLDGSVTNWVYDGYSVGETM